MLDDERLRPRPDEVAERGNIRFRALGCYPLIGGVESKANTLDKVGGGDVVGADLRAHAPRH